MENKRYIASVSWGKDSLAMLLLLLRERERERERNNVIHWMKLYSSILGWNLMRFTKHVIR